MISYDFPIISYDIPRNHLWANRRSTSFWIHFGRIIRNVGKDTRRKMVDIRLASKTFVKPKKIGAILK